MNQSPMLQICGGIFPQTAVFHVLDLIGGLACRTDSVQLNIQNSSSHIHVSLVTYPHQSLSIPSEASSSENGMVNNLL